MLAKSIWHPRRTILDRLMENDKEYDMDTTSIANSGLGDDFDALVAAEIAKGAPPSVAPQRRLIGVIAEEFLSAHRMDEMFQS